MTCYISKYFLSHFETFCSKLYIRKYSKEFSTYRVDIVENVIILQSSKIPQETKFCNTPNLHKTYKKLEKSAHNQYSLIYVKNCQRNVHLMLKGNF